MSRERAHRRAERERAAAAAAVTREREAQRRARSQARRTTLTRWLPRPPSGPTGALAVRRRQQTGLLVGLVLTVNLLTWLGTTGWPPRALVLLLSLLLAPIATALLIRK